MPISTGRSILTLLVILIPLVGRVVVEEIGSRPTSPSNSNSVPVVRALSGSAEPRPWMLRGAGFVTSAPGSWTLWRRYGKLGTGYALATGGRPPNSSGVAEARSIAITIEDAPAAALKMLHLGGAARDADAARQSPLELLPNIVGVPEGAEDTTRALDPTATVLGGLPAAEDAYTYTYEGLVNDQLDLLSKNRGNVVLIELSVEPAAIEAGKKALAIVTSQWRWTHG
jgi:hypothetical protein